MIRTTPINKQVYHPLFKKAVDLGKTEDYAWANEFFKELKYQRKFALRLGRLAEEQACFNIKPEIFRKILTGSLNLENLTEKDFTLSVSQKGVDFILDPMRSPIKDDLFEHIDGIRTKAPKLSPNTK